MEKPADKLVGGTKDESVNGVKEEIPYITEIGYLYDYGMTTKYRDIEGVDIARRTAFVNEYENILINREIDENNDLMCLSASIEGRKHGACIVMDSKGKIVDVKFYNQGEEIDLSSANVGLSVKQDEQGNKHYSSILNGKPFGWEMILDSQGKAKVAFFDENGVDAYAPILRFDDMRVSGCDLAQELMSQDGDEQQLTGQYAVANAKFNVGLSTRAKECKEPIVEEKHSMTSSLRTLSAPELER